MKNIEIAAQHLLEKLHAPAGAVTILPWEFGSDQLLRVLVDPANRQLGPNVPKEFEGFRVVVEPRQTFSAQSRR